MAHPPLFSGALYRFGPGYCSPDPCIIYDRVQGMLQLPSILEALTTTLHTTSPMRSFLLKCRTQHATPYHPTSLVASNSKNTPTKRKPSDPIQTLTIPTSRLRLSATNTSYYSRRNNNQLRPRLISQPLSPLSTISREFSCGSIRRFGSGVDAAGRAATTDEKGEGEGSSGKGAMKGKLLTTPSRLFKLIIPLYRLHQEGHIKGTEPIAILIHPHQPLSYLEHVIQSELTPIKGENGRWRAPGVSFIALQLDDNSIRPKETPDNDNDRLNPANRTKEEDSNKNNANNDSSEEQKQPPSPHNDNKRAGNDYYILQALRGRDVEPTISKTTTGEDQYVRWSLSTEINDFVRDAARVRDFIVSIEGAPANVGQIHITVPSFNERTYFLRMRLRKISQRLKSTAEIKHECDIVAQRGAQRVAVSGFFVMAIWWSFVYTMTFRTNLGWDTMEPVTYLVSLSSLMGGYLWFLYHNREISYKSALDITVNTRQRRLYQSRGVDLQLWETLLDEGKALRRKIKGIAAEYDVEWNERLDEEDEQVTQALREKKHHEANDGQESEDNEGNDGKNEDR